MKKFLKYDIKEPFNYILPEKNLPFKQKIFAHINPSEHQKVTAKSS